MPSIPLQAVPLILLAVMLGFLNGKNDSANVVAPLISTHALGYRRALILAAIAEGTGPFLLGIAVAKTIGNGLIRVGMCFYNQTVGTGSHTGQGDGLDMPADADSVAGIGHNGQVG